MIGSEAILERVMRVAKISVLPFFWNQEPGTVCVWRAERRSESECAHQVEAQGMKMPKSHVYDPKPL